MTYGLTYGRVSRRAASFLALAVLTAWLSAPPLAARPAPASEITVTLLSVSESAFQVQGADGRAFSLPLTRATWLLRRGLVAAPRDFLPGETLRVRRGRGKSGPARLVCDPDTADALASYHRRPVSGTLLGANGAAWTVQPSDSPVPLPVCLGPRTTFAVGGRPAPQSAFGAGASVTITLRGLANGLLGAVTISDAAGPDAAPVRHREVVSGIAVEVRPDLGLLTLRDKAGQDRTVSVSSATRVKIQKRVGGLADIAPGMRVTVYLRAETAASIAAFFPAPSPKIR